MVRNFGATKIRVEIMMLRIRAIRMWYLNLSSFSGISIIEKIRDKKETCLVREKIWSFDFLERERKNRERERGILSEKICDEWWEVMFLSPFFYLFFIFLWDSVQRFSVKCLVVFAHWFFFFLSGVFNFILFYNFTFSSLLLILLYFT